MKKIIVLLPLTLCLGACISPPSKSAANGDWITQTTDTLTGSIDRIFASDPKTPLTQSQIAAGLRESLSISAVSVTDQLSATNGFHLDPKIHIPLPGTLGKVHQALSGIGMGFLTEDLERRMNRAAEAATPKAKALFISAIQNMTINDARAILTGPNNAATTYLRGAMGPQLAQEMQPFIQDALNQAGAIQAYDRMMGQYANIPFMPNVKADLQNHVTEKALDGIFYYVAQEEAAIRENPRKRTTELLRTVFGG